MEPSPLIALSKAGKDLRHPATNLRAARPVGLERSLLAGGDIRIREERWS